MPETAPLDVNEHAVGYELDSITLRNIASVRFVRHHEWLDHVLGSPLPSASIIPPKIMQEVDTSNLESRMKQLDAEIAELEAEKAKGWQFHVNDTKAATLSQAIYTLRKEFGSDSYHDVQSSVEDLLGVKIEKACMMRPVEVTYDRKAALREQVKRETEAMREVEAKREAEVHTLASDKVSNPNNSPHTVPPVTNQTLDSTGQPQQASPHATSHNNMSDHHQVPQQAPTPQHSQPSPALQQSRLPLQQAEAHEQPQMYSQQQQMQQQQQMRQQQMQQSRIGQTSSTFQSPHLSQSPQQFGVNSPTPYGLDNYSHPADVDMQ